MHVNNTFLPRNAQVKLQPELKYHLLHPTQNLKFLNFFEDPWVTSMDPDLLHSHNSNTIPKEFAKISASIHCGKKYEMSITCHHTSFPSFELEPSAHTYQIVDSLGLLLAIRQQA
jgi:hypothetical protein